VALEARQKLESPRHYLGASQIGEECVRKLFYSFRNVAARIIPASGIKAIQDGFAQEDIMAARLRLLPYIELVTEDPKNPGQQLSMSYLKGHFRGHLDGVIKGIREAEKTWHVWENKAVNDKKFDTLLKLRESLGEKETLKDWDDVYFSQCQIYMLAMQLDRHYLTVQSPGGRRYASIRTNLDRNFADELLSKANVIINSNWSIPAKLSDKPDFYKCKWCEYQEVCHEGKIPLVHCKTCRYSTCVDDGKRRCDLHEKIMDDAELHLDTCPDHVFNPCLIPDVQFIEHQEDGCIYKTQAGMFFGNFRRSGLPDFKYDLKAIHTSQSLKKLENVSKIEPHFDVIPQQNSGTTSQLKGL